MYLAFTGGGTGGHVVPNLAVIAELKNDFPDAKILYIGSYHGIENRLVDKRKVEFHPVYSGKLRRYFSLKNLSDIFKIPIGVIQSFFILRKKRPKFLFSKGGFVSVPAVIAAHLLKIPIYIHESDLKPGLANKTTLRFAKCILTSFPETADYLDSQANYQLVGSPVRPDLFSPPNIIRKPKNTKKNILVMGGSQGAAEINRLIDEKRDLLTEKYNIFHIRGKNQQLSSEGSYYSYQYLGAELADIYHFADLVISRGGANSLAEIAALNKRAIILPLSKKVSRGEQIDNAYSYQKRYNWHVIEQPSADELFSQIEIILKEKKTKSKKEKTALSKIIDLLKNEINS